MKKLLGLILTLSAVTCFGGATISTNTQSVLMTAWTTNKIPDNASVTNTLTVQGRVYLPKSLAERVIDYADHTNTWVDAVFPATTLNPVGPVSGGTILATSGPDNDQIALELDTGESFWVPVQFNHDYEVETTTYPHVHIELQTANTNYLEWEVKSSTTDIGGTFPASTTTLSTNAIDPNVYSQWQHVLLNVPAEGLTTGGQSGPSTIMRLRLTLTRALEPIHIVSFDVHYLSGGSPVPFNP